MSVTYNKTNWVNDVTPLDANNMNNIENGIENLVNEVNAGSGSTITVDSELSDTSENPVQNKAIKAALGDINKKVGDTSVFSPSVNFEICFYTNTDGVALKQTSSTAWKSALVDVSDLAGKEITVTVYHDRLKPCFAVDSELHILDTYSATTGNTTIPRTYTIPITNETKYIIVQTYNDDNRIPTIEGLDVDLTTVVCKAEKRIDEKADINNPLSLAEANRTRIGFIIHDYAASTGERYVLSSKDGVTLDDTTTGKSKIPSSYVVGQYVQAKIAAMTPVKGTDYFTEADKQEIINAVIAELSKQQ